MATTVVIGGGVIGLTLAHELRQRGDEVILIDRKYPGAGSSAGNAGWVVPSIASPVPAPGLPATALKWMADPESPLYIKPRFDPGFIRWLWDFFRACRVEEYRTGRAALVSLAGDALKDFDRLRSEGVEFEMTQAGLLIIGFGEDGLDHYYEETDDLAEIGYQPAQRLSGPETRELEPALSGDVAGSVFVTDDRHVRPESLVAGLVAALRRDGVELRDGTAVTGFRRSGRDIVAVTTETGEIEADRFVLAAGAWSGALARSAGFSLPIEAGKGYSITVDDPNLRLQHPLDLIEARAAVTPFDGALRFAGTMEISGINMRYIKRRADAIWRNAQGYLREPVTGSRMRAWVGMRPMTPDGLPVIGRLPGSDNLYVATGHQMLGVTLAPTTARALAEIIVSGSSSVSLTPFDPLRFL